MIGYEQTIGSWVECGSFWITISDKSPDFHLVTMLYFGSGEAFTISTNPALLEDISGWKILS